MNVELVAQMFKNYQSNVLFHLEGMTIKGLAMSFLLTECDSATDSLKDPE